MTLRRLRALLLAKIFFNKAIKRGDLDSESATEKIGTGIGPASKWGRREFHDTLGDGIVIAGFIASGGTGAVPAVLAGSKVAAILASL
jgi:hypothetical protein